MTRLVDRLEAKQRLRRTHHRSDRRAVAIELTDRGTALLPEIAPVFGRISGQVLAGFSDDEVATLTSMLQRILVNLNGEELRHRPSPS